MMMNLENQLCKKIAAVEDLNIVLDAMLDIKI